MKKIQELLRAKLVEQVSLVIEISNLRQRLQGICDHSNTEPYVWEHDNGYGRQSKIEGKRCLDCLFVDLWNRKSFIDPRDVRSDYGY